MSNNGKTALNYAAVLGWAVFPLAPRSKVPATAHGCKDASKELIKISEWWDNQPDCNIGLAAGQHSGCWILDVDGEDGRQDLEALIAKHGELPITPVQKTANGRHYFWAWPDSVEIRNTGKLIKHTAPPGGKAGGLETRGNGGYVVLAPSLHPDTGLPYEWLVRPSQTPLAQAPQWLIEFVTSKPEKPDSLAKMPTIAHNFSASGGIVSRRWVEKMIAECLDAVRGAGEGSRNNQLNISALRIGHCVPVFLAQNDAINALHAAGLAAGLPSSETMATIASGLAKGMAEPFREASQQEIEAYKAAKLAAEGRTAPQAAATGESFDPETGEIIEAAQPAPEKPSKYSLVDFDNIISRKPPNWVIDRVFPEKSFGIIYGAPKKGKSFVALDMALCVASGLPWHGHEVRRGNVLYIVGEGLGGLGKRLKAWKAHNQPESEIAFYGLVTRVNMRAPEDVAEILKAISAIKSDFSLIIIDTVARALLGGDENSATDIGEFIAGCDLIKDATGAAVIGVHHTGKDEERGMRGSSAMLAGLDTCILVKRTDNNLIVKMEEQKDAEPIEDMAFEMVKINTGFGEDSLILKRLDNLPNNQKRLNGRDYQAMQCLYEAVARQPLTRYGCPATKLDLWKDVCFERRLSLGDAGKNATLFGQVAGRLRNEGYVAIEGDVVWIVVKPEGVGE